MTSVSMSSSMMECGVKCRSSVHQTQLTSVLSCGSSELASLAWCHRHCGQPGRSRDSSGRTLVHVAAANGLVSILEWLLRARDCPINSKDTESGYTALHRAMFHGRLRTVVFLIQSGANTAIIDHNGLTVLDHAVLDRPLHLSYDITAPLEAYVWGNNSNYNLGLGTNTIRHQPDIVESLRKDGVNISKVCLQKFHSAMITRGGKVLTCGHGRGGRLGHGAETMQLVARPVTLPAQCTDVSLGVDHSLFLTEGGTVFSCGDNAYHQLGHHYLPQCCCRQLPSRPRPVLQGASIQLQWEWLQQSTTQCSGARTQSTPGVSMLASWVTSEVRGQCQCPPS